MKRLDAVPYISVVLDDTLSARRLGADPHARVYPDTWLIGWQCGFEPMFVAVHSYLPGAMLDADEAVDLVCEYLEEVKWFNSKRREPDYVIEPIGGRTDA